MYNLSVLDASDCIPTALCKNSPRENQFLYLAGTHAPSAQSPSGICPVHGKSLMKWLVDISIFLLSKQNGAYADDILFSVMTFYYYSRHTQIASTPMPEIYWNKMVSN